MRELGVEDIVVITDKDILTALVLEYASCLKRGSVGINDCIAFE
jgi:hypothetical protein